MCLTDKTTNKQRIERLQAAIKEEYGDDNKQIMEIVNQELEKITKEFTGNDTIETRREIAEQGLDVLVEQGLISEYSYSDGLYSFSYATGGYGGLMIKDWVEEEN